MRARFALSLGLAAMAFAPRAHASPIAEIAGAVGGNAGAQGVVTGPGAASAYFNPALLPEAEDDVVVGVGVISEQIGVTLDGRRGGEVPLTVGDRQIVNPDLTPIPNTAVPTQWLKNGCDAGTEKGSCPPPGFPARPRQSAGSSGKTRSYLTVGFTKSLIKDRLAIGAYGVLPIGTFTTARAAYVDEREALFTNSLHPELYGDRMTAISMTGAVGLKILPALSIGAGLSIGFANSVSSASYVRDSTNYDTLLLNNSIETNVSFAPIFGLRFVPASWLRFGAAAHGIEQFVIDTNVTATLPSGTQSGSVRHDVYDWTPWTIALGGELDVFRRYQSSFSIAASANYAFWSAYRDRHGEQPTDYGQDLAWKDTLSGTLGVRWTYKKARGYVDTTYVPSAVPEQIGRSNYVDNDRIGMFLGGDVEVEIGSLRLRPGLQLFTHRLIRRHNTKDDARMVDELPDNAIYTTTHDPVPGAAGLQTNNPGWPGFASQGWIYGGTFSVTIPL